MKASDRILGFDGIRGVAVISVILHHMHFFNLLNSFEYVSPAITNLFDGVTGVQAFFVLSGFLITLLLIKEMDVNGDVSVKNFYIRRVLRIFQIYFMFLFLLTLLTFTHNCLIHKKALFFAYTYSYNFIPQKWYSAILGHTWSLDVEEHFYLLWPFIFIKFFKTQIKFLVNGLCIAFLVSIIINKILHSSHWVMSHFFIEKWTFIAGSNIIIGCFFALILTEKNRAFIWINLIKNKWALLIGLLLYSHTLFIYDPKSCVEMYIRGAGIGTIIAWIYLNQKSKLVSFLEFPPLQFIGIISYGVYLWQGFFLSSGPERIPGYIWPPHSQWIGLLLLIVTAPLSYYLVEKPLLKLKEKFARY